MTTSTPTSTTTTTTTTAATATSGDPLRVWPGPAVLSYGFRPFFLAAAIYAAVLVAVWVPWFLGFLSVPTALTPIDWHAHELLFGYVAAVIAGFLLTAIPNWTGRRPIRGLALAGLVALWLAGRVAVAVSSSLDPLTAAALALGFALAITGVAAHEIVAARNWRNVKVVATVGVWVAAQILFYYETWRYGWSGYGVSLGIAATVFLILIIGGRIVPSFTGTWLRRANPGREPVAFNQFDRWTLVISGGALAAWVAGPAAPESAPALGVVLIAAGVLNLWRQTRWAPDRTVREPLVTVLHGGYFFVPIGFLLAGAGAFGDEPSLASATVHAWTVGAIGLMTLAVMTRASRSHSGRPLTAGAGTVAIYAAILVSALARVAGPLMPEHTLVLVPLAGVAWIAAFLGFTCVYGPMLVTKRVDA